MELYRPSNLVIQDNPDGGFRIVDEDNERNQLATVLEFNPMNSDISISMAKEFAQYLIEYYNHNYK